MTKEQVAQNLKVMLEKQANKDLALVRKTGSMAIINTKSGTVEVRYRKFAQLGGQYMIVNFNNTNFAHMVGRKKEAIAWLVANYEVIND